jgi:hypothetical protein
MMRLLICFSFLAIFHVHTSAQCQYSLVLQDNFGDGWDLGLLTYTIGNNTGSATLNNIDDDGSSRTLIFTVNNGDTLDFTWSSSLFNDEVSIQLLNADGDIVFDITEPADGSIYMGSVTCPSCPKVTGVYLENVFATTAKVRWTPVGNAQQYRIVYGATGFLPGAGDTLFSNTPKATIPGLIENTDYQFYITTLCGGNDTSLVFGPYAFTTYFSDDIAVTAVDVPVNNCNLGSTILSFSLTNFGANPQTLFTYGYSVNGIDAGITPPMDGLYTGVIGKDSTVNIIFESGYDFTPPGEYEICVYANLSNDDDSTNNIFCYRINNRLQLPYTQNFETWGGGWVPSIASGSNTSSWEYGTPKKVNINKAYDGQKAWVTGLEDDYPSEELSYLTSPCFDLSSLTNNEIPAINCQINRDLVDGSDGVTLEVSTNDGLTWTTVGSQGQGLNWYNGTIASGEAWTGQSNGWEPVRSLINAAQGKSRMQLRFVFQSDFFGNLEGIGIDQIQIAAPQAKDLAIVGISTLGDGTDCGLASDSVVITVANFGTQTQLAYSVNYSINGGATITQNIGQAIVPNEIKTFQFAQPFNSTNDVFEIVGSVDLLGDQVGTNDSTVYTVSHKALGIPFVENFESGNQVGWTFETGSGISAEHGNISNVLSYNLYINQDSFQHTSPVFGPIGAGDTLTYDYRVVSFANEAPIALGGNTMRVLISTDCGDTYTLVDAVNGANHVPSGLMKRRAINLQPYIGSNIKVRFKGTWASNDFYFDLDNIGIRAKDVSNIDLEGISDLKYYPNPATQTVTIEGDLLTSGDMGFALYNLLGERVKYQVQSHAGHFVQQLDISELPNGVYFLQLQKDKMQQTVKLIKSDF